MYYVAYCFMPLFNKFINLYCNIITNKNAIEKMEIETQWKLSSACILRYLIINIQVCPYTLYQDQSDKTP